MSDVIETLRAALAQDAAPEARAAGVAACRAVLATLDPTPAAPPPPPLPDIAGVVSALRGVPSDQLLDLAIAKLRTALPPGTDVPAATPLKFQLVPVRRRG